MVTSVTCSHPYTSLTCNTSVSNTFLIFAQLLSRLYGAVVFKISLFPVLPAPVRLVLITSSCCCKVTEFEACLCLPSLFVSCSVALQSDARNFPKVFVSTLLDRPRPSILDRTACNLRCSESPACFEVFHLTLPLSKRLGIFLSFTRST